MAGYEPFPGVSTGPNAAGFLRKRGVKANEITTASGDTDNESRADYCELCHQAIGHDEDCPNRKW